MEECRLEEPWEASGIIDGLHGQAGRLGGSYTGARILKD